MATATIHVQVLTFDPAQKKMIPVEGAKLLVEHARTALPDPNLSSGNDTTDADGKSSVELTFEESEEFTRNPYFTITVPEANRTVPAAAAAKKQLTLPDDWETPHAENKRLVRITEHTDPSKPLKIYVGLHADLRIAYADFDSGNKRNPIALPERTVRVYLADYDEFLWIDWLNPDDTLKGFGYDAKNDETIEIGDNDDYPYSDTWPTQPLAITTAPAFPHAQIDPPKAPIGTLGGGSFLHAGPVAVDLHGFVFVIDGNEVHRFYPDGTLCESIVTAGGSALVGPKGLACDQHRNLFVANTGSHDIEIYRIETFDGGTGSYVWAGSAKGLAAPAGPGAGLGRFNAPEGLAVVPNRTVDGPELLAVADTGNRRVQVFRITLTNPSKQSFRTWLAPTIAPQLTNPIAFGAPPGAATAGARSPNALFGPVDVAADRAGKLYVADKVWHRISRWAPDTLPTPAAYNHEADWESAGASMTGAGNRDFNTPEAIAVDMTHGAVYIAESGNQRVQRLDAATGNHQVHWTHTYPAPLGVAFTPAGVAVDARGEVYASDSTNERVLRASAFSAAGTPLGDGTEPRAVGDPWTPSTDLAHMRSPGYVAVDGDQRLLVSDTQNDRVQLFSRTPNGTLVRTQLISGAGLERPVGVVVDPEGGIFVVDSKNGLVRRYSSAFVLNTDPLPAGALPFNDPRGIAIVQRVEPILIVADRGNNRIQLVKRDGTPVKQISTAGTAGGALNAPEDVAVDSKGNWYVADTGKKRIVQFDAEDNFVRQTTIVLPGSVPEFSGISVDDEDALIVTDRANARIVRIRPDGTVLAHWDFERFLKQDRASTTFYEPEHKNAVTLQKPTRAVIDGSGLLAVADTDHHRVRLLRTETDLRVNLFDLGESLPDISLRAVVKSDWRDEIGLKLRVGDVNIFDESHDFISTPQDDFSDDIFKRREIVGSTARTSGAINLMKVMRTAQQWLAHLTRKDEEEKRWGTKDTARKLDIDFVSGGSNYTRWNTEVNMSRSTSGRGHDAWDDSVVVHEMTHWVVDKTCRPKPPYGSKSPYGSHSRFTARNSSMAFSEGFASYTENFWGGEFASMDRVRGKWMSRTRRLDDTETKTSVHLFGGPSGTALPTFDAPGYGLKSETYFSNCLYQIHMAITDPSVLFADRSHYWHRYNVNLDDDQSQRFVDTLWKALRSFPKDPTDDELGHTTKVYLRNVLSFCRSGHADFAQIVESLFELNNQAMPRIVIHLGNSTASPGAALGATTSVSAGSTRDLIVRVEDVTGAPLAGYNVLFHVKTGTRAHYVLPGAAPAAQRGRVPSPVPATQLVRATDANGGVRLTLSPAGGTAGTSENLEVSYQPDFDTDATFAPPAKGDDLEKTLRQLYLYELRTAAKTWDGTANNFGAKVTAELAMTITA